jgi:hypothetical protein
MTLLCARIIAAYRGWLHTSFLRSASHVAAARIACALFLLFGGNFAVPEVGDLPEEAFLPPLGPFQLLSGFPPRWLLVVVRFGGLLATLAFLFGRWPRWTGLVVTLSALAQSGVAFSIGGKIDHTILLAVLPFLLGAAEAERERGRDASGWPLAVLALCIAFALFSSGFVKLTSGWLALEDSSVYGYLLRNYYILGRDELLGHWAVGVDLPWLWEALDWTTVVLETSFLFGVLWPRLLRLQIVGMALLHIGIMLLLEINFAHNVVAYAALLVWPERWVARIRAVADWLASLRGAVVVPVASLGAVLCLWLPAPEDWIGALVGKALFGAVELAALVGLLLFTVRPGLVHDEPKPLSR